MKPVIYKLLTLSIAFVWLVNGLLCKVAHLVPRHQSIVARLLGEKHAVYLTTGIGILEIGMAGWILSRVYPRVCAVVQIGLVVMMNALEFVWASDLLLFGRMNAVVAVLFISVVYGHAFVVSNPESDRY